MKKIKIIVLMFCVWFSVFNLARADDKVRLYYTFYSGVYSQEIIDTAPVKISVKFLDWPDQSQSSVIVSKQSNFYITKSILISQDEWKNQHLPTKAQIEIIGQNLKSPILDISLNECHKWHHKTDTNLLITEASNQVAPDQVVLCSTRFVFED